MTQIDTIETVASGAVAMLNIVTRNINGEDGFESTEERLFALLVNLTQKYAEMTLEHSYPTGVPGKDKAVAARIQGALVALEENLVPASKYVRVFIVSKDRAGDGGFFWNRDRGIALSQLFATASEEGSSTVVSWVERDLFVPIDPDIHEDGWINSTLTEEYENGGWVTS